MSKFNFVIFVLLIGFALQTQSMSVVNNVTISSDFAQEIFFNEIRWNLNLSDINTGDIINARKCILQLRQIVNQFPSYKVARFVDSWGKFPSGLLYGHLTDLGNYDQCIRTSVTLDDDSSEVTNGQYCFASFSLGSGEPGQPGQPDFENDLSLIRESPIDAQAGFSFTSIKLGVCVPAVCDAQIVTTIFQNAAANVLNGAFSGVTIRRCSVAKKADYETMDIVGIVFFSLHAVFMVLSSLYDFFTSYFEIKPVPLLMTFSIITNGRKLFMINTKKSPNTIDCLTGIRLFSMIWVLHCHDYMFFMSLNVTNLVDIVAWFKNASTMPILMGTVSVDSFFFLSGLLVAWMGLREMDRTKGKLNVIMMWVHRYIRLTPPLSAGILFLMTVNKFIGSGPYRDSYIEQMQGGCSENWWTTLLYVQNYVSPGNTCFMQSWYLAIDTQLYILSPLLLIPLWKWGKKFIPVLVTLSFLSMGCVIATFIVEGYTSLVGFSEQERMERVYVPTHTRLSVWLVGFGLGYFMHINREKSIKPSKIIQLLGWIVCFGTILSIIFGPYFKLNSDNSATVGEAAVYEAMKRTSWGIALAWIVFASHFGFGGIVNSFLSHPFWQPLGRLTYCMYLVHMGVQCINYGIVRTDVFFSDYTMILFFWSNFGISIIAAIAFSLAFEAPVLAMEKIIFGGAKPKVKETIAPLPSAPIAAETSIGLPEKIFVGEESKVGETIAPFASAPVAGETSIELPEKKEV